VLGKDVSSDLLAPGWSQVTRHLIATRCRTFSTFHVLRDYSLDPIKRDVSKWTIIMNELESNAKPTQSGRRTTGTRIEVQSIASANGERITGNIFSSTHARVGKSINAQDPIAKLRRVVHYSTKHFAWFSESLPWKSHVPIRYEEKVQHKCAKCVLTKHGGFKVW
jgi:hypothetical protein